MRVAAWVLMVATACAPAQSALAPAASGEAQRAPDGAPSDVSLADAQTIAELSKHAEAILAAFGNRTPRLASDGRTLVFSSNRDGIAQLYVADGLAPRSEVRRLVTREDRIASFEMVPRAPGMPEQLVFRSDHGGDDKHALYAVQLDGQNMRPLTSDPTREHGAPLMPAGRPGVMVFTAREPRSSETPVHELSLAGTSASRVVYTDPGVSDLVDVSPDGSHALLRRLSSSSEQVLLDLDLIRGEAQVVYPRGDARVAVHAARFAAKGDQILVATDAGMDDNLVLALDRRSGDELWRYRDELPTAKVQDLRVSPDGKIAALLIDAGSRSALRFVDIAPPKSKGKRAAVPALRSKLRDAQLAAGDGELGPFTADGSRVLARWALPDEPGTLFSVSVASGQPSALRIDDRPSLAALPALTAVNLEIPAHDGLRIPINLYVPKGGVEKKPILVMVHGGPAASSSIGYNPLIRFYTAYGFGVVEPNVRGSTGFGRAYEQADDGPKRLDALRDLQTVAEWIKTQPWADPSRLVLWGGSYGGYMVLMGLTRQPSLWRAGVDMVGPSNWRSFFASTTGPIREILSKELGSPETDAAFLDSISPLAHAAEIRAPLFVFQGQNDPRVPRAESDRIVTSLRARKIPVEYLVAPDEGHSLDKRKNQVAFLARTTLFLRRELQIP